MPKRPPACANPRKQRNGLELTSALHSSPLSFKAIDYIFMLPWPETRRALLEIWVRKIPALDLRGFRNTCNNVIASLADPAKLPLLEVVEKHGCTCPWDES